MLILQLPDPFKVQLAPTVPEVVSDELKVTVPVGVIVEFVVSVTVTEQELACTSVIDPGQEMDIDVLSFCPDTHVTLKVPSAAVLASVRAQ